LKPLDTVKLMPFSSAPKAEFLDPRLVAVYDYVNPVEDYDQDCLRIARDLGAHRVVDLGCGTGLLTQRFIEAGFDVTGIEPAEPMLTRARARDHESCATWLRGGAELVQNLDADLVLMTGHVAQFFLEDDESGDALRSVRSGTQGHLLFDSRNPNRLPFGGWPTEQKPRTVETPAGTVRWWHADLNWDGRNARYVLHYLLPDGAHCRSVNQLVFRGRDEIERDLRRVGFTEVTVYSDWQRSSTTSSTEEMVFLAGKRPTSGPGGRSDP
jgi:SAM-dependent methyltransferase